EPVLLTHFGLSGPGILQISNVWREGRPVELNLFPGEALEETLLVLKRQGRSLHAWLKRRLPRRFAQVWIARENWPERLDTLTDAAVRQLASNMPRWTLWPEATAGYDRAEVTLGGVATEALSGRTMMAREVPGLFFVGEVVDITGQLGGYNFQWAWSSGHAAGTFA
ncbi:NAD(P)/FAD-dependent oxidoreductase, partial [Sulfurivirga sp.]|uniref:NAD(P)/FAD-dependent oxidoreductase n=1 Tax=Sulfurivirga sp. TaxID=2614236 RepID=UPI0025F78ACE